MVGTKIHACSMVFESTRWLMRKASLSAFASGFSAPSLSKSRKHEDTMSRTTAATPTDSCAASPSRSCVEGVGTALHARNNAGGNVAYPSITARIVGILDASQLESVRAIRGG
jgi:hypothetical protein